MRIRPSILFVIITLSAIQAYASYIPSCRAWDDSVECSAIAYPNGTLSLVVVNHGKGYLDISSDDRCSPDSYILEAEGKVYFSCELGRLKGGSQLKEEFSFSTADGLIEKKRPISISTRVLYGPFKLFLYRGILGVIAAIVMLVIPAGVLYYLFRKLRRKLFLMVLAMLGFTLLYMILLLYLLSYLLIR